MARRRLDRVGLLLGGVALGFALSLLALYLYVDAARNRVVEDRVRVALGLPEEAFELEDVEADGTLRILLRDVAFLDRAGDTIVSAPAARARLLANTLNADGPIVFDQGEVLRPNLRLVQDARGEWNVFQIFAVEAGGQRVRRPGAAAADESNARPLVFRDLRIVDGRARVLRPTTPPTGGPPARYASGGVPERVRVGGRWLSVTTISDLDVNLASVRVGGAAGWRVDIASASARVRNPDTRIEALAGWVEDRGDEKIRFDLQTFRTPFSALAGAGTIDVSGAAPAYDVRLRADRLDFRDLAGMGLAIPRQGAASFNLAIETLARGRTRWTATDASVAVLDSRASGRVTAITGPPGTEIVFTDTRLNLDPLYLRDLETLGFAEDLPVGGVVRGTVASLDQVGGAGGALRLDLAASLTSKTTVDVPASVITARGDVRFGGAGGMRFDGLRVEADPLYLATVREATGDTTGFLRGTIRGGAVLTGTLQDLRVDGGDLAYRVGDAPETRLRGLSGRFSLGEEMRYTLEATADPLALATLTELFPALPFRAASLSGPIRLNGTRDRVAFDVDLDGASGGIAARGTLALGAVPRFDVSGTLLAFRPGTVLAAGTPVEGPLSGTFAARGSTQDFRFDVDLTQPGQGRFVLGGSVRRPGGGSPVFDVAGRVENFQLGLALGQPGLLPGRVTGPIRISGGGGRPYAFDIDVRGEAGVFDVEGTFTPGAVPRYAVSGRVQGLDLSGLPFLAWLPRTVINGTLAIDGRGTTAETFVGTISLDVAPGSTIGGIPVQTGIVRMASDGQVLRVDDFLFAVRGARLEARGQLGITREAPTPLTFSLEAPNLAAIRPLLPGADTLPDLSGALSASGTVTGTVRAPAFGAAGSAAGFRYGRWAARSLTFRARGRKAPAGWTADANVEGSELEAGGQRLQALTLELNATPGRASFGLAARRDAQTDLTAAGTLELAPGGGLAVSGAILDNLVLRVAGTEWRLNDRARVAWSENRGLQVENLLLRRTGPGGGYLAADGVIPPSGNADFRLHAEGIDLAEARRIFPAFPEAAGRLRLDATLNGAVNDPRLSIDARVDSLRFGGALADSVHVVANYASGRLDARAGVRVGTREVVDATATVPMTLTLGGIVPGFDLVEDGPLTVRLAADSVPLGLLAASVPTLIEDAEGVARAQISVDGTPADPRVSGSATLENAAFTPVALGARWERVNGRVSLSGETIRVDSLTARTSDTGWAFVNGTVVLDQPGSPRVDLAVRLEDFHAVANPELADLEVDGELALRGRLPGAELTGWVRIEDGEIFIPEFGEQAEADILDVDVGQIGADTATAPQGGAALLAAIVPRNLRVLIGGGVWLQSADARIQIQGDNLTIDRPPGSEVPLIYGDVEAVRGRYTFELGVFRREFEIVEGRVQFFGTPEINPALDITAEHEVRGGGDQEPITVVINLTGTLQNPRVQLSSDTRPPLPESELAELLVFGRRADQLGGLAEELASGVLVQEALGNLLTAELEEELIQAGIVDYFRVYTRSAASTATGASTGGFGLDFLGPITIEAGREIVTNVFLSLQALDVFSDRPRLGAAVEWEISRTLTLRAAVEPVRRDPLLRELLDVNRQATVDLRARWEYGRPNPEREADIGPQRRRRQPDDPAPPGEPSTPSGEPPPPPPPSGTPRNEEED